MNVSSGQHRRVHIHKKSISTPNIMAINKMLEIGERNIIDSTENNLETKLTDNTRNLSADF